MRDSKKKQVEHQKEELTWSKWSVGVKVGERREGDYSVTTSLHVIWYM